jgi:hypothetical protein
MRSPMPRIPASANLKNSVVKKVTLDNRVFLELASRTHARRAGKQFISLVIYSERTIKLLKFPFDPL